MVVGEKENLHPNSSQQNDLTHIDTNVIKPLGVCRMRFIQMHSQQCAQSLFVYLSNFFLYILKLLLELKSH